MTTAKALLQRISDALLPLYEAQEAMGIGKELLYRQYGCSNLDIAMDAAVADFSEDAFQKCLHRLQQGEPVQYVTGWAHFYGHELEVDRNTLIPRPETEELVHLFIEDFAHSSPTSILDIGTGSGCIPIALQLAFPWAIVSAMDCSKGALRMAQRNAERLKAPVRFIQADILLEELPRFEGLSALVSNPPYVRELEKASMHRNVLDYEPDMALFVPNNDPLLFYRRIAQLGQQWLSRGGRLYFEINEALADEMRALLENMDYSSISIHKDMQGKHRMARAVWMP